MGGEASTLPASRVKFMCSHGGKILPRPTDGQLKYVGGETRVLAIPRNISFSELKKKLMSIFDGDVVLKYQLLPEDLEALVSVTCDEDLKYMLEEYDRQDAKATGGGGSPRLRAFLFPPSPFIVESPSTSITSDASLSEQRYIDALNCIVRGSLPSSTNATNVTSSPVFTISSSNSPPQSFAPDTFAPEAVNHDTSIAQCDGSASLFTVIGNHQNSRTHGMPRVKSSPSMHGMNRVRSSPSLISLSPHHPSPQAQQQHQQQNHCHCFCSSCYCHHLHYLQQVRPACLPAPPTTTMIAPGPGEVGIHQMGHQSRYYSPVDQQRVNGGYSGCGPVDGWRGVRSGGRFPDAEYYPQGSVNWMGSGPRWNHHGLDYGERENSLPPHKLKQ